ncbi:twin-arginine translocation signal domain-containing protein [Halorubrum sp. 48-1-W]|nr:twin-arginine translocation signal domain-containing protein [Halorubrum sp. 48-1-W]
MSRKYGDRRTFLKGIGGAATAVGLAGCSGLGGDPNATTSSLER